LEPAFGTKQAQFADIIKLVSVIHAIMSAYSNHVKAARSEYCRTIRLGVLFLKTNIEERACDLAVYIIENKATVRSAAKQFGISKSTVHKDLSERLQHINRALYVQVKEILEKNKAERHIRGGNATRRKYKGE